VHPALFCHGACAEWDMLLFFAALFIMIAAAAEVRL
jgi:Na+/H+ antiporter NhaD/arsenite permease-like protein